MKNDMMNIKQETIVRLRAKINVLPKQIISKTLTRSDDISVTLFGIDKGKEVYTQHTNGDVMVTVLSGKAKIMRDGKVYELSQCDSIMMPSKQPQVVYAKEPLKMCLVVVSANG